MRLKVPAVAVHRGKSTGLPTSAAVENRTQRLENAVIVIASGRISIAC
jgi:hypothetical protein